MSSIKQCQNCKQQFTIEPEDFTFYKKIQVPPPTFCYLCRFQRRIAYRQERTLYRRKCDLCSEMKVMSYSSAWTGPVYCPPCWWSDKWDGLKYGVEYDFSKPFFLQFHELRKRVPQMGLATPYSTMINSDYCHMAGELKNCFLRAVALLGDKSQGVRLIFSENNLQITAKNEQDDLVKENIPINYLGDILEV